MARRFSNISFPLGLKQGKIPFQQRIEFNLKGGGQMVMGVPDDKEEIIIWS